MRLAESTLAATVSPPLTYELAKRVPRPRTYR